jgi:hypothetical protein
MQRYLQEHEKFINEINEMRAKVKESNSKANEELELSEDSIPE